VRRGLRESWYDVAQVCMNGHLINSCVKDRPQHNKAFCRICGAKTICNCPSCEAEIQGNYHVEGVAARPTRVVPKHCHSCGSSFPWIQAKIDAATELANELEGISDGEKEMLAKSLDDIISETPRTELAVIRFKKVLSKSGGIAKESLVKIVTDFAVEAAKKMLLS